MLSKYRAETEYCWACFYEILVTLCEDQVKIILRLQPARLQKSETRHDSRPKLRNLALNNGT